MRSFLAALRTLVLPYGTTTGQRIVLDGVNGEIDAYNSSNVKSIQIGPGPIIDVNGTGVISILDPGTNKELDLMVQGGSGNTPEIMMSGHGTFGTGSMSAVIQMDDLGDQVFRFFMGQRGQDDSRASINQWDIAATRNTLKMHGYDVDLSTATTGWIYDGTAPGAIRALIGDTPETWHNATKQNGWVNRTGATAYDIVGYRKLPIGNVQLRGSCQSGTGTNGTIVFNLPAGYRPANHKTIVMQSDAVAGGAHIDVSPNGDVTIFGTGAGPLYFDGVQFEYLTV